MTFMQQIAFGMAVEWSLCWLLVFAIAKIIEIEGKESKSE